MARVLVRAWISAEHTERMMPQPGKFWDKVAERYARQPVADEESYQKKLQVTRQYFRPDMDVLEFGCGTGSTAIAHAPYVKQILAVDVSPKMLELARGKADAENVENVTFRQADITGLSVPDESLDAVMGHSILHLVDDKDAVIAKVRKMLKPDGLFITSTACLADTQGYLKLVLPIMRLFGLAPQVTFFTRKELLDGMIAGGFEIDHEWQPGKNKAVFVIAKKKAV
jgi:ubiquinone/menaquinone biosynthesis C-methylase UbiE